MIDNAYYTYDFRTSESKILRHLNSVAFDPNVSNGYHGHLTLHADICCSTKAEAMQAIEDLTIYKLEDHGVLYFDKGRKTWLVKATWRT